MMAAVNNTSCPNHMSYLVSVLVNLVWPFQWESVYWRPIKMNLFHLSNIMCWCLYRHSIPSDLHSESEKGSIHTSERESFVDSDVEESSQLGSLRSYLPSVGLGPLPPHHGSQPYSHSAADAWSTHYQASLRSSGSGSHLPLQAQSTGPSSPIHAQPDTQPTPDFIRTLPYPMQDSAAHEVCIVAQVCVCVEHIRILVSYYILDVALNDTNSSMLAA